jgi:hypothetical protein
MPRLRGYLDVEPVVAIELRCNGIDYRVLSLPDRDRRSMLVRDSCSTSDIRLECTHGELDDSVSAQALVMVSPEGGQGNQTANYCK